MVGPTILKRAQMLVEDTKQKLDEQREIVASLEKRGLDSTAARNLLGVWEETLQRRFAILDQMRTRLQEKRDRK
jgi:hypothetical protein